jgi:hypothetical protein
MIAKFTVLINFHSEGNDDIFRIVSATCAQEIADEKMRKHTDSSPDSAGSNARKWTDSYTELIVFVDFNFPWGLEHPGVFLPCGLVSLGYPRVY